LSKILRSKIILIIAIIFIIIIAAAALYVLLISPGGRPSEPGIREIEVKIYRNYTMEPSLIRVYQGESVKLLISSQVVGRFHIHEPYDIEVEVGPGKIASASFDAKYSGRIKVELHYDHQGIELGAIEILPR